MPPPDLDIFLIFANFYDLLSCLATCEQHVYNILYTRYQVSIVLLLAYRTYTKNCTVSKYCAQVGRFEWNTLFTSSLRVSVTLFLWTCITLALSPPSCSFLLLMVTEKLATDIQREIEKLFISLLVLFSTSVSVFCNHLKPICSNQTELSFLSFWQFDFSN